MKMKVFLRAIALMLCLTLLGTMGLAEGDVEAFEAPVQEEAEFALSEPEEAAPEAVADDATAPDEAPVEADIPAEAAPEAPVAEAPAAEEAAVVDETPAVEEAPDTDGTSPVEEAPASEETLLVQEAPAADGTPVAEEVPVADGTPTVPETEQPEAAEVATDEAQMVAAPDTADAGTRSFSQTITVESETWKDVNLVRASGFGGALAQVNGQLTLVNATIDGKPAREADLGACFTLGPNGAVAIQDDAALALSLSAFCFNKGNKKVLSVTWNGAGVRAKKVKWATSNKKVAKVSKGKISAKKAGTALITATYEGATASCLVVVTDYKQVKSLKLNPKKMTLALYGSQQLGLTIKPADAFNPNISWTSSNPAVASVDQNGWVAGLSGGTAVITAVSGNGKKAKCKLTVKEVKPEGVAFEKPFVTLNPGKTFTSAVRMTPEAVSNPTVRYSSSNTAVATVSDSGVITAKATGIATITVTADANGVQNTCRVSVIEPGSARMEGLTIGINPGHQRTTITKLYPLAPGSSKKAKGVKTGACGKWTRVNEYETTLAIGLKLADLLTQQGATVVITRTTNDVMLTNIDRAKMLNDAGVDVALQLHCNSISNTKAEGNSAYIRTTTEYAEVNRAIGKCITAAISAECGCKDLGVKVNNNYMSLNWTTTPSVLLEMGYISNKKEDALLASDAYRNKMAVGIMEGLCAYFGR